MPPIITYPSGDHAHTATVTFWMKNAHDVHPPSQIYSWRVKVGSVLNGHNYYLGNEIRSNGYNEQSTNVTGLPPNGTCYTKVEYRKVPNGPWWSGTSSTFKCI